MRSDLICSSPNSPMVSDGAEASVGLAKGLSPMTLQETEPRGSPAVARASKLPLRHSQPFQKAYSLQPPATHWAVDPEAIREVGAVVVGGLYQFRCICFAVAFIRCLPVVAFGLGIWRWHSCSRAPWQKRNLITT